MKKLLAVSIISILTGCASHGKSDEQIYQEAAVKYASTLPSSQSTLNFPSVKILSHGLIADSIAMAAGGGANATILQEMLLKAKASGDTGFLIIGSSGMLDISVVKGAFESQDFSGLDIFYSGSSDQENDVRALVENSKANFHYISAM